MEDYGYEFYHLEPEQIRDLPVDIYPQEEIRELSYFVWAVYPEDDVLQTWRDARVLPLLRPDLPDEED